MAKEEGLHEVPSSGKEKKNKKDKKRKYRLSTRNDGVSAEVDLSLLDKDSDDANRKDKRRKKEEKSLFDSNMAKEEGIHEVPSSAKEKKTKKKDKKRKHRLSTGKDGVSSEVDLGLLDKDLDGAKRKDKRRKKGKQVSFSENIKVFPSSTEKPVHLKDSCSDGLVRGKRFSEEENVMIKEAVYRYIEEQNLGEDGLYKVLHSRKYPEVRGCWDEIASVLPWRPKIPVYKRAHVLFSTTGSRKYETEELEIVRRHYEKHGAKWKQIADLLGRHKDHVKDAWRRNRLPNRRYGRWSQDEIQKLFDLVNSDLQMKFFEGIKVSELKKAEYGMLRNNISWYAISEKLSTRTHQICCLMWYKHLSSPMVRKGLWADTDDYLMVDELLKLDACCIEDVDWENLLEHRSGKCCRKRWIEMTRQINGYKEKSFMEQVDLLAGRYCPEMLPYRTETTEE